MAIFNFRTPPPKKENQSLRYGIAICRVSDERQKQKNVSLPAQRSRIEKWAAENNITIVEWFTFDHSAYRNLEGEKKFQEAIEYALNDKRISLCLVDEKGRFARSKYTRVVYEEKLRLGGVKLVGVSEPEYDRKTIHGVWMDGITMIKNEAISVEIAYHVMKGMGENAELRDPVTNWCFKNGGTAPDGYKNNRIVRGKDTRGKDIIKLIWEVNEERKNVIRYIVLALWLSRGMSWNAMRDHLNSDEPKWDSRHERVLSTKGSAWAGTSIREICIRALEGVYSGIYYWNRTGRDLRGTGQKWKDEDNWKVVENAHPAIITLEEWEELKHIRGPEITRRRGRGNNEPRAANSRWLLSGKNAIGEPFFVCLNGTEEEPHHLSSYQIAKNEWYACSKYQNRGAAGCDKPFYVNKNFEDTVFEAILNRFSESNIKKLVKTVNYEIQEEIRDTTAAKNHLLKNKSQIEKEIKGFMSTLVDASEKTRKLILTQIDSLVERQEELDNELLELEKEQPRAKLLDETAILNYISKARDIWVSGTNAEKREFLRRFVYNLELDPEKGIIYINFIADPVRTSPVDLKKKLDSTGLVISGLKHARPRAPMKARPSGLFSF